MRKWMSLAALGAVLALSGCGPTITVHHTFAPIVVQVTINHEVQQELENFFKFEEARGQLVDLAPTTGDVQ